MASQFAGLHSKSPQIQIPCTSSSTRSSTRCSRSITMVPQPPLQPLSDSESAGCRIGNVRLRRLVAVESHRKSNLPLVSPDDHWSNLAVLFSAGALGIWSEKTKMGSALSGPLVSTLLGLAASNFGIIASDASALTIVMEFLLPLAYPMLLFKADLRNVIKPTGTLLLAFLLGSVGTTIGSIMACILVPMPSFGQILWQVCALVTGTHIYGAIKFPDISDAFRIYSLVFSGGLVADNEIRVVYYALLFALTSKLPPETTIVSDSTDVWKDTEIEYNNKLPLLQSATSVAVSFVICKVGSYLTKYFGIYTMPAITTLVVILATIFPKRFAYLASSGEAMAMILMQVFFVVLGAKGNISVANRAPHVFMFSLVQISVHFVVIFGLGKWLRFDLKSLVIASIGNVGGPTIVYGMAATKGWGSIVIPGILAAILRIYVAACASIGLISIGSLKNVKSFKFRL